LKKIFSVAVISVTLIAGGIPISQTETTTKTVEVGEATVKIERIGSNVSIHVKELPQGGELTVSRGSLELLEVSEGLFKDKLPAHSSTGLYTLSLESPLELDSAQISKGVIDVKDIDSYVNLDVVSTLVPGAEIGSQSAYASTTLPSRTRFRYQTFIPGADTAAPAPICAPPSTELYVAFGKFLGDTRSWNADSTSYRTRSDVVVDWGAGGTITPDFSVGETTLIVDYYYPLMVNPRTVTTKKTASSETMKLVRGAMSSSFVSFRISANVTNPHCWDLLTNGIFYDFAFYVHRDGTYVVDGTLLRVPNHELYSRNNVNSSWRTIFQTSNQGFECLALGAWWCSEDKYIRGDLIP
jgi:hypothetical protein